MKLVDKEKLIDKAEDIINCGSPFSAPMLMVEIRKTSELEFDEILKMYSKELALFIVNHVLEVREPSETAVNAWEKFIKSSWDKND